MRNLSKNSIKQILKTNPVLDLKLEKQIIKDVAGRMATWIVDWDGPNRVDAEECAKAFWNKPTVKQVMEVDIITRRMQSAFRSIESKENIFAAISAFRYVYSGKIDPHSFIKKHCGAKKRTQIARKVGKFK